MKTTIDIPNDELQEAIRLTGAKTKREAVVIALSEFNRRRRLQKLAEKFGTLEGFMTQEELRRMGMAALRVARTLTHQQMHRERQRLLLHYVDRVAGGQ